MKITALLPIKNEAWCLRNCLHSLRFCDEILAVDDNSTDGTREILQEFNTTILTLDTNTSFGWKEYEIRQHLLNTARDRGVTHIIAIDGDEMCSDAFVQDARNILADLRPGETLSLPWINVSGPTTITPPVIQKVFAAMDDRKSVFDPGFLHIPRVPIRRTDRELKEPYAILHFQYLNTARSAYKRAWYMVSELLNKKRHPIRINTTYPVARAPISFDVSSLTKEPLPDYLADDFIWQKEKVLGAFEEKGIYTFEQLDIWNIPELRRRFIKTVGREPKPFVAPFWLLRLNDIKNWIKNYCLKLSYQMK